MKLLNKLQGKKTYLVAIAFVVYGVAGVITGSLTAEQAYALVLNGVGFGALRNSIK